MRLLGSKIVLSWFKDGAKMQVHQSSIIPWCCPCGIVSKARLAPTKQLLNES